MDANLEQAQDGVEEPVKLQLRWYNENVEDMVQLGKSLASDASVKAVIGPYGSENAQIVAAQLSRREKTMILPCASSSQFIRAYARQNSFLWALTESDISQCEVMLTRAISNGARKVGLLCSSGTYGQTFYDWFAFQAVELGLEVSTVRVYGPEELDTSLTDVMTSDADMLLCVPNDVVEAVDILKGWNRATIQNGTAPRLIFSDVAFNTELFSCGINIDGVIGTSMYADPESGFPEAYRARFGDYPTGGDAQFYDALMLVAFGLADCKYNSTVGLNAALRNVVETGGPYVTAWDVCGMKRVLDGMRQGERFDIRGAGGQLDFDTEVYTNVLHSVYCEWMIYNNKFIIRDYCTSDGSNRTASTLANWNWDVSVGQTFSDESKGISYPSHTGNWVLIVAGSTSWVNYRHQADALNMYQILKRHGYDDEHIILILADDLAQNPLNPYPGGIMVRNNGENVYENVDVDYHLADLHPEDIKDILNGNANGRLTEVVRSTSTDNVLVFWSGHGLKDQFVWGEQSEGFTTELMRQTMTEAAAKRNYRKMLWLIETCYSESVALGAEGVEGVLCITAANRNEPSKADVFSNELGNIWLSNRFTSVLHQTIDERIDISFRALYYQLFRQTIGSHVCVVNESCFDNLYLTGIREFIETSQ